MSYLSKVLALMLLVVVSTSIMAQNGDKKSRRGTRNALKMAKEHLRFEEFNQAIPVVEDLLDQEPNSAIYNFWMGKCLYITYKKNTALAYFKKVDQVNPDVDKEFHYYYGLTLHYNLDYDKAITEYRKDLNRYESGSPDHIWVTNRISQCQYAKKISQNKDAEQVKIENMGEKINTEYSEHSPVISANDSLLIITARRPESLGANPESHFYDEDIYISHRTGDGWEEVVNIDRPVNTKGHDATISLSADGQKLYLYRHKKDGALYVTDFDTLGQKWKKPRSIKKPLNSKYYEASICQSADSSILFFTSDRPGGYGGRDIYMVNSLGKSKWTEPKNLGPTINTPFDEDAPYFHPDGKTLYYSSNGPNSIGGFDIFVTEMDSLGASGWLEPINMGMPVNTADDDIYFVLSADGKNGYYASGKEGGYGEKDIYHLKFPYYPYPRRFPIIELTGVVQDIQTLDTISALVKLIDNTTSEVLDSVYTGLDSVHFYFILEPQKSYSIEVSTDGYNSLKENLETPTLKDNDLLLEKNILMSKVKVKEEKVVVDDVFPEIQHIYYDFDQDDLRDESRQELDIVAQVLKRNPDINLNILAHTDWYGTYDYNVDLSRRRADAAFDYLIEKKGVNPVRLEKKYFSENVPIDTNEDDEGRQYNRRSEFQFVKNDKLVFSSIRLRDGVEGIVVDKTKPKGEPGFDNPTGRNIGQTAADSDNDAASSSEPQVYTSESKSTGEVAELDPSDRFGEKELELHHIYFEFDKYDLQSESETELRKVLKLMEQFPELTLEIYGHADSYGSLNYNQKLSEKRAEETRNYFRKNGIQAESLVTTGFSELRPIDSNGNDTGRQNNRRVEFRLIKDGQVLIQSVP